MWVCVEKRIPVPTFIIEIFENSPVDLHFFFFLFFFKEKNN